MPGWLDNNSTRHGITIIAATGFIILVAYGLVEGVLAQSVSTELFFIIALVLPAFCLPATAFRTHAKEKQHAESIIKAKSRHLNEVLDNMAQGLCMFDGEQRLIVCNERYASLYDLPPELQVPGTSFDQILESRVASGFFSGADKDGYIQQRHEEVSERVQSTKIDELGDGRFISISHSPMEGGGWVATHEDITEQKKADKALMESEARFRAVFENSPFCQNLKDTEGRILFANKRYEDWWGHDFERVVGKKAGEYDRDEKRISVQTEAEKIVMETGETHECEVNLKRPCDGELRDRWLLKFPIKSPDGEVLGLGTYAVDITERKQAEEELICHRDHLQDLVNEAIEDQKAKAQELEIALEKEKELNELQRQFVAMASHEFRTPLAIIDTTAQRIKSRADNDKLSREDAKNRVKKIRGAVRRMTRLMESTLTAARMEEGKVSVEIRPCNIRQIIREVCARQQEIGGMHTITCELDELPASIEADEGSIDQVLSNLLSNAVKYSPDATQIEVRAGTEGDSVFISVRDHGLGIDEEDLPRIGERFFRAKSSTGITGTGIGLNLVNTLVDMHGGLFSVESKKDEGSTFTFSLPIAGPAVPAENETENTQVA